MLKLGIESGDQSVLDGLEKGTSVSDISVILKNLRDASISTYVYLLFGTPQESYKSGHNTLHFIRQHADMITFLNLAIFNMPLNSPDINKVKTRQFSADDLSLYTDFTHPSGWNRKEVRNFLDKEFKRTPEIASILRRDPPFFTSNHAPFFCPGFSADKA